LAVFFKRVLLSHCLFQLLTYKVLVVRRYLRGAFLMSSVATASEVALAELGLAAWDGGPCDVLIGGLGLGYTAEAALRDDRVRRLEVVEALEPVIGWHERGLVPASGALMADARCRLVRGDFFAWASGGEAAAPGVAGRYDVVLVDIDHSPEAWLAPGHGAFYREGGDGGMAGLAGVASRLSAGGVFGLWSAEPVGERFLEQVGRWFESVREHPIEYAHPILGRHEHHAVVIARGPRQAGPAAGLGA